MSARASWAPTALEKSSRSLQCYAGGIEGLDSGSRRWLTCMGTQTRLPSAGWPFALGPHRICRMHDGFRRPSGARRRAGTTGAPHVRAGSLERRIRAGGRPLPHGVESEFPRATARRSQESQVGAVLSGLGFPQRDWKRRNGRVLGRLAGCASRSPNCCPKQASTCCCLMSLPITSIWKRATG